MTPPRPNKINKDLLGNPYVLFPQFKFRLDLPPLGEPRVIGNLDQFLAPLDPQLQTLGPFKLGPPIWNNPLEPKRGPYGLPEGWFPPKPEPIDITITPQDGTKLLGVLTQGSDWVGNSNPWMDAIVNLLNQVKAVDVDLYNVPVNQGNSLRRFSEFSPKDNPPDKPNLTVRKNTTARIHGEVRPIKGWQESLITRFVVDYSPTFIHSSGLEIQGFSAADPPYMEYDRSFSKRQSVVSVSNGDRTYENPLSTGSPLVTPFDRVADAPPKGHKDWMITFNPVQDTLWAGIQQAVGSGSVALDGIEAAKNAKGTLWLWAFLPTMGLTTSNDKYFKKFGIRYNTMPRKLGDLVQFFGPKFDSHHSAILKHHAPFYNPNSEYMALYLEKGAPLLALARKKFGKDYSGSEAQACGKLNGTWKQEQCKLPLPEATWRTLNINEVREKDCNKKMAQGKGDQCQLPIGRQKIPKDCKDFKFYGVAKNCATIPHSQVKIEARKIIRDKINPDRKLFGVPEIGASRGTIIDWVFLDVMKDPERLKKMKKLPHGTFRLKFRPTTLKLPIGELSIDESTDIKIHYSIRPATVTDPKDPGKTITEAQIGLKLEISPLKITKTDLQLSITHVKAQELQANKLIIDLPSLPGWDQANPRTRPPTTAKLLGVQAKGLHVTTTSGEVDIAMIQAQLEQLDFKFEYPPFLMGNSGEKFAEKKERKETCDQFKKDGKPENCREPQWSATLTGLKGTGLKLGIPTIEGLVVQEFNVPKITLGQTFNINEKRSEKLINQRVNDGSEPYFEKKKKVTIDYEVVPNHFSFWAPELKSKGTMDLNFKSKDSKGQDGTKVSLAGKSTLKNIKVDNHFLGDRAKITASLDLMGTIESAAIENNRNGQNQSVRFTTQNEKDPKPLSGSVAFEIINMAKIPYQKKQPKGPPPQFNIKLDLPYVGFESDGDFKIPAGSSTLRNGSLNFDAHPQLTGSLEGQLELKGASYHWGADKPLGLGRIELIPHLSDINSSGKFKFEILPDGVRLKPLGDPSTDPLSLKFSIKGTEFFHHPDLTGKPFAGTPQAKVIETKLKIDEGILEVRDLRNLEIRSSDVGGLKKSQITQLEAGPIMAHHLKGSGSIWVDLLIWGFVRGFFPKIGSQNQKKSPKRPDSKALTAHFPTKEREKIRKLLGNDDFFFLGKINFERKQDEWLSHTKDLILNIHEEGGRNQFGMVRIPEANVGVKKGLPYFDLGSGNFLLNIFLNEPDRGGSFRLLTPYRWKAALRKAP